jgi:hypothetical protein
VHACHRERQSLRTYRGFGCVRVLHIEDGFTGLGKRLQLGTLFVLPTLLVHRTVGHGFYVRDESVIVDAVFQEPSQAQPMDVACHLGVEADLIGQRQGKAGVVRVRVVDIRFHPVEALRFTLLEAGVQYRLQEGPLADVDVALVRVPRHGVAEEAGRVPAGIRPIVFPRSRFQIAERFCPLPMDLRDQGRYLCFGTTFGTVVVDVVNLDGAEVGRCGDRPAQVVLPRDDRARLPPSSGGTGRWRR